MNALPRTAELLLEALGADSDFRDDLLGDLAEEFSLRVGWDGIGAARRWYYREALRTMPHLVRDWFRRLRARDIARLLGLVLTSYVFTATLVILVVITVRVVMDAWGITPSYGPLSENGGGLVVVGLVVSSLSALVGGYIAAWLDERAPLVSALSLGVVWSCGGVALAAARGVLGWNWLVAPVVLVVGAAAGGILRVWTSRTVARDRAS